MKIALGIATYYPESTGGTEKYVHELAKYLTENQIEVVIITPSTKAGFSYHYEDYKVHTFEVPKEFTKDEAQGNVICRGYKNFEDLIKELQPNIFHLHSLSTSLNTYHLEIVKNLHIKTLFTAHIPGTICPKGDFIMYDNKVCDGKLLPSKCGHCYAKWRHKNNFLGEFTGRLAQSPLAVRLLYSKIPQLAVTQRKQRDLEHLKQNTSFIIPTCQWLYDTFIQNGFSKEHLKICRQGVNLGEKEHTTTDKNYENPIKIGFIGRLSPEKGLHNLLNAFLSANMPNLELHVVVIKLEFYTDYEYFEKIDKLINSSDKIHYQENMPSNLINKFLEEIHILSVPSVWLETGPLTVYEALNQNVPIIGSNIGGVKELVENNETGFLYDFNDIEALKNILIKIANQPEIIPSLIENIKPVRSVLNVGKDMVKIYQDLFS